MISGQSGRLTNLGYFSGDVNQPEPADFKSAVEEFQCDHGLAVDGICGPITQASLRRRTAAKASEERLQGSKGPADRAERAPWQKIKKVSHNISDGGVSGSHSLTGPIRFLVGPTTPDQRNIARLQVTLRAAKIVA